MTLANAITAMKKVGDTSCIFTVIGSIAKPRRIRDPATTSIQPGRKAAPFSPLGGAVL